MKNAENVNFCQVDNQAPQLIKTPGVVLLSSNKAWLELDWVRQYWQTRPKAGYFIWVKKEVKQVLSICLMISAAKVRQELRNLVVIEPGVKAEMKGVCRTTKAGLAGEHKGESKVILKQGAELRLKHWHDWNKRDKVSLRLSFRLEKDAKLFSNYWCMDGPDSLDKRGSYRLGEGAIVKAELGLRAKQGKVKIKEDSWLEGKGAGAVIKAKLVGDGEAKIKLRSKMTAQVEARGHLDCRGLLLSDKAEIEAVPKLVNQHSRARLTHEASIGRILEDNLNYLRSRGLSEAEAVDLVVAGFLSDGRMKDKITA